MERRPLTARMLRRLCRRGLRSIFRYASAAPRSPACERVVIGRLHAGEALGLALPSFARLRHRGGGHLRARLALASLGCGIAFGARLCLASRGLARACATPNLSLA